MTVNSTVRIAGPFAGNGSTTTFPFPFKVFEKEDLEVIILAVGATSEQVLVLDSDYSATLNANQDSSPGGSISLIAGPLASGATLTITTDIPELQETDLTNGGGFYPEVITGSLDYLTILIQQLEVAVDASIKFPQSEPGITSELPPAAQRAGAVLGFDANGNLKLYSGGFSLIMSRANGMITGSLDGANNVFTLAQAPLFPAVSLLALAGSILPRALYSISGTTLTFNTPIPPQRGDTIELYCS